MKINSGLFKINSIIIGSAFIISCTDWGNMKIDLNQSSGIKTVAQTGAVTNITENSVSMKGKVIPYYDNLEVSFVYGICDSLGVFDWESAKTVEAEPSPISGEKLINVSVKIGGLMDGTTYGYYIVVNQTYGKMEYFSTIHPPDQIFEGGIKFYVDSTGQHGLIAAPNDLSIDIKWTSGGPVLINAFGTALGTGQTNTTAIVTAVGNGSYAAKVCDDYESNGYSDWFLPSRDELNLMYKHKASIGGFNPDASYWSSSEIDYFDAWIQGPNNPLVVSKVSSPTYVRAIRAF
jgi:hypothetical protein